MNLVMAFAALLQWGSLDLQQKVNLEQDLVLEQASGKTIQLNRGTKFVVKEIEPLDQIQVQYYQLQFASCPDTLKNQISEMTVIQDNFGVQLSENCEVGVFVEFKDIYTNSVFSPIQ